MWAQNLVWVRQIYVFVSVIAMGFVPITSTALRRNLPVENRLWRALDRCCVERSLHTRHGQGETLTNNKIKRGKGTLLVSFENVRPPTTPPCLPLPPLPYLERQISIHCYNYMNPLFKLHPFSLIIHPPLLPTLLFLIGSHAIFAIINYPLTVLCSVRETDRSMLPQQSLFMGFEIETLGRIISISRRTGLVDFSYCSEL
jgi:hypothetical protein